MMFNFKTFIRMISRPFQAYNKLLETNPLFTKCVTSGVMYAGGDMIAQLTEHYQKKAKIKSDIANQDNNESSNNNETHSDVIQLDENDSAFQMSWKRALVFFTFGNVIAGPSYHYWFNYLNELPTYIWQLKQTNQRYKILRAYATLKIHGIEVNLDLNKIPKAAKLSKWASKGAKIAADQLIFSSTYTLIFFLCIGIMNGAIEKYESERRYEEYHNQVLLKKGQALKEKESSETELDVEVDQRHFKTDIIVDEEEEEDIDEDDIGVTDYDDVTGGEVTTVATDVYRANGNDDDNNDGRRNGISRSYPENSNNNNNNNGSAVIDKSTAATSKSSKSSLSSSVSTSTVKSSAAPSSVSSSTVQQDKNPNRDQTVVVSLQRPPHIIAWDEIWDKTWTHTKSVYLPTYLADCIVWPPIQLINFTFIPVRFQFLYVNFANLAWNTYLSLMANNGGGHGGHGGDSSSSNNETNNNNNNNFNNRSSTSVTLTKLNPTTNIILNNQQQGQQIDLNIVAKSQ